MNTDARLEAKVCVVASPLKGHFFCFSIGTVGWGKKDEEDSDTDQMMVERFKEADDLQRFRRAGA